MTAFNLYNFLSIRIIHAALALVFLGGCSSSMPAIKLNPKVAYKFTGKFCDQANDKCYVGVGTLPERDVQRLDMYATRADIVRLRSCNRTRQLLKEGTHFEFIMTPNEVEKFMVDCDIKGEAFDLKKELHDFYWAMIERPGYELPVVTHCDGFISGDKDEDPKGIGACQVKKEVGTALIKFKTNVKVYNDRESCPLEFFYDSRAENNITVGRDFFVTPDKDVKGDLYKCEFLEQVPPFRKAIVGIRVYEDEIFPKEN